MVTLQFIGRCQATWKPHDIIAWYTSELEDSALSSSSVFTLTSCSRLPFLWNKCCKMRLLRSCQGYIHQYQSLIRKSSSTAISTPAAVPQYPIFEGHHRSPENLAGSRCSRRLRRGNCYVHVWCTYGWHRRADNEGDIGIDTADIHCCTLNKFTQPHQQLGWYRASFMVGLKQKNRCRLRSWCQWNLLTNSSAKRSTLSSAQYKHCVWMTIQNIWSQQGSFKSIHVSEVELSQQICFSSTALFCIDIRRKKFRVNVDYFNLITTLILFGNFLVFLCYYVCRRCYGSYFIMNPFTELRSTLFLQIYH